MVSIPTEVRIGEDLQFDSWKIKVLSQFASGDISDLYLCEYDAPVNHPATASSAPKTVYDWLWEESEGSVVKGILKVAKNPADNDLLENEHKTLSKLFPDTAKEEKHYRYLPKTLTSATVGKQKKWATLLSFAEGFVSLADVMQAYPKGVGVQDMAWMFRRILEGMYFVHHQRIIHGALLPPHILVHPTQHGAKIVGWSYSVPEREMLKAIPGEYRDYYPPEVFDKNPTQRATDVYLIAKTIVAILGGNVATNALPDTVPEPIRALLLECLDKNYRMRPSDVGVMYDDLSDRLFKLMGKPKYHAFTMPGKAGTP